MKQKRTLEEEQVRQLKILNAQQNPLGVLIRIAFWLTLLLVSMGLLARLYLPGPLFR